MKNTYWLNDLILTAWCRG